MFSTQLGRVARASNSLASHTPATTHRTAAACLSTAGAATCFVPKQRRLSSSKASSSPDDGSSSSSSSRNNGAKPIADASEPSSKSATSSSSTSTTSTSTSKTANGRRGNARNRRAADWNIKGKKAAVESAADAGFDALPRVAGTDHLHPLDISLSSFFSLHRPISLTNPLPPTTTPERFASLFEPKQQPSPTHVIYTLSNTIDALDPHSAADKDAAAELHWQVVEESPSNAEGVKHLDGAPRPARTVEEMVSQLRPFMAPPPPALAVDSDLTRDASASHADQAYAAAATEPKKSFRTTITVTESTSPDGVKHYTASTSPMVRVPSSEAAAAIAPSPTTSQTPVQDALRATRMRQPFLERMRNRHLDWAEYRQERDDDRNTMQLISVKRQRKLKMKKHKYKKLMKRTRNLRRRLDRN